MTAAARSELYPDVLSIPASPYAPQTSEDSQLPVERVQGPAPPDGDAAPDSGLADLYLSRQSSRQASERWQAIQTRFVDDPRRSVAEAHRLVGQLMSEIAAAFAAESAELERQWSTGAAVSTEDLRLSLQRYRAFFSRLLLSVPSSSPQR
jgi:hypothetical protein